MDAEAAANVVSTVFEEALAVVTGGGGIRWTSEGRVEGGGARLASPVVVLDFEGYGGKKTVGWKLTR